VRGVDSRVIAGGEHGFQCRFVDAGRGGGEEGLGVVGLSGETVVVLISHLRQRRLNVASDIARHQRTLEPPRRSNGVECDLLAGILLGLQLDPVPVEVLLGHGGRLLLVALGQRRLEARRGGALAEEDVF